MCQIFDLGNPNAKPLPLKPCWKTRILTTIEGLKPRIKRWIIKNHAVFERSTNTLSQELFLDMFANHNYVSNILRVETKRETMSIQAVLGNKRISMIIKGFTPRTKREEIKEKHSVAKHKSMIPIMFLDVNGVQAVLETVTCFWVSAAYNPRSSNELSKNPLLGKRHERIIPQKNVAWKEARTHHPKSYFLRCWQIIRTCHAFYVRKPIAKPCPSRQCW